MTLLDGVGAALGCAWGAAFVSYLPNTKLFVEDVAATVVRAPTLAWKDAAVLVNTGDALPVNVPYVSKLWTQAADATPTAARAGAVGLSLACGAVLPPWWVIPASVLTSTGVRMWLLRSYQPLLDPAKGVHDGRVMIPLEAAARDWVILILVCAALAFFAQPPKLPPEPALDTTLLHTMPQQKKNNRVLIRRVELQRAVVAWLDKGKVVWLVGPSGCGKSEAARDVVRSELEKFGGRMAQAKCHGGLLLDASSGDGLAAELRLLFRRDPDAAHGAYEADPHSAAALVHALVADLRARAHATKGAMRPLVVVLDDANAADTAVLDAVRAFAAYSDVCRVVATSRAAPSDTVLRKHSAAVADVVRSIPIASDYPMRRSDIRGMLERAMPDTRVTKVDSVRLYEACDGSPYLMRRVVMALTHGASTTALLHELNVHKKQLDAAAAERERQNAAPAVEKAWRWVVDRVRGSGLSAVDAPVIDPRAAVVMESVADVFDKEYACADAGALPVGAAPPRELLDRFLDAWIAVGCPRRVDKAFVAAALDDARAARVAASRTVVATENDCDRDEDASAGAVPASPFVAVKGDDADARADAFLTTCAALGVADVVVSGRGAGPKPADAVHLYEMHPATQHWAEVQRQRSPTVFSAGATAEGIAAAWRSELVAAWEPFDPPAQRAWLAACKRVGDVPPPAAAFGLGVASALRDVATADRLAASLLAGAAEKGAALDAVFSNDKHAHALLVRAATAAPRGWTSSTAAALRRAVRDLPDTKWVASAGVAAAVASAEAEAAGGVDAWRAAVAAHEGVRAGTSDVALAQLRLADALGRGTQADEARDEAVTLSRSAAETLAQLCNARDHPALAAARLAAGHHALRGAGAEQEKNADAAVGDALKMEAAAVEMLRRLHGGQPHPALADACLHYAADLDAAGRADEAAGDACEAAREMLDCVKAARAA